MSKNKLNFSEMGKRASEAGQQLAAQDRQHEEALIVQKAEIPLDAVLRRPDGDTRPVDPLHVLELAESIVAVDLLEPLVVDQKNRLIAGAHRLAAIRLLAAANRAVEFELLVTGPLPAKQALISDRLQALPPIQAKWQVIPVRRLSFDAQQDHASALAAEVAENERRRDYTRAEIKNLAERLKKNGFRHTVGRPKTGEKSLVPALETIVGKSRATIWRMLGDGSEIVSNETISDPLIKVVRNLEAALRILKSVDGQAETEHAIKMLIKKLANN